MNRSASRTLLQLGALGTVAAGSSAWAATVQLKLKRGLHLLTAQFSGDGFDPSLSWPSLVLVL